MSARTQTFLLGGIVGVVLKYEKRGSLNGYWVAVDWLVSLMLI